MKIYTETNDQGEYKIIDKGKIKIRILRKPSKEYKVKLEQRAKKEKERRQKEEEQQKQNKLINEKMRELAIKELKKDGKL